MRRVSPALKSVALSLATLAIGFVGNAPAFAQPQATGTGSASTSLPAPVALRLQGTTQLDSIAPNASLAGAKCDANGNVFVRFGNYDFVGQHMQLDSAISEVIPESKRVVIHRVPALSSSDYPNSKLMSFGVSLDGVVYALISTRRNASDGEPRPAEYEYYVEQLKEGVSAGSMTHLQTLPGVAHWVPVLLGAFPKGNFLIAGQKSEDAGRPGPGSWRPFTAIYDSSGRFLIELNLPEDVVNHFSEYTGSAEGTAAAETPPAKRAGAVQPGASEQAGAPAQSKQSSKPHEYLGISIRSGGIVSGPDGNLWILRASDPLRLYAVDAAGQVVKHFQLSPPVAGSTPQFGFAGPEQIFFAFTDAGGESNPHPGPSEMIGVFDIATEQFNALYTVPRTKGFLGCADGRGGFIYVGSSPDRRLALFDYRP